jgi:hypothetical protein
MISKAYGKYIFGLILFGFLNQTIIIIEKLIQKDKDSEKMGGFIEPFRWQRD